MATGNTESHTEKRERQKATREYLGKLFSNLAVVTFTTTLATVFSPLVLGILDSNQEIPMWLVYIGIFGVLITAGMATTGYLFTNRKLK